MHPTPERFQRLARSAPYRWRELLLEGTWSAGTEPVRVRVERPDRVHVTRLDGTLLHEGRKGSLGRGALLTSDGSHVPYVPDPDPTPELDADGFAGPRRPGLDGPEVPFWHDYHFVAVLDPYELSEGVDVLEVRAVEHGGRPAWEALLRPTEDYFPRCPCCALMHSRECDLVVGYDPQPSYADAHLLRLDVGTGVCVRARQVGGPEDGQGHELVLLSTRA